LTTQLPSSNGTIFISFYLFYQSGYLLSCVRGISLHTPLLVSVHPYQHTHTAFTLFRSFPHIRLLYYHSSYIYTRSHIYTRQLNGWWQWLLSNMSLQDIIVKVFVTTYFKMLIIYFVLCVSLLSAALLLQSWELIVPVS